MQLSRKVCAVLCYVCAVLCCAVLCCAMYVLCYVCAVLCMCCAMLCLAESLCEHSGITKHLFLLLQTSPPFLKAHIDRLACSQINHQAGRQAGGRQTDGQTDKHTLQELVSFCRVSSATAVCSQAYCQLYILLHRTRQPSANSQRHIFECHDEERSVREATNQGQKGLTGKWPAAFFVFWCPLEAFFGTACPGMPCGGPACPYLFLAAAPGMAAAHTCCSGNRRSLEVQIVTDALIDMRHCALTLVIDAGCCWNIGTGHRHCKLFCC